MVIFISLLRARAGTLSNRVREAKLGLVRGKYLLASMLQRLLIIPLLPLVF